MSANKPIHELAKAVLPEKPLERIVRTRVGHLFAFDDVVAPVKSQLQILLRIGNVSFFRGTARQVVIEQRIVGIFTDSVLQNLTGLGEISCNAISDAEVVDQHAPQYFV